MNWILLLFLFLVVALYFSKDKWMSFKGVKIPNIIAYGVLGALILLSLTRSHKENFINVQPADYTFDSRVLETSAMPPHKSWGRPRNFLFMAANVDTSDRSIRFTAEENSRCLAMGGEIGWTKYTHPDAFTKGIPDKERNACLEPCPPGQYVIRDKYGNSQGCEVIPRSQFSEEEKQKCLAENGEVIQLRTTENVSLSTWYSYPVPKIRDACVEKCPEGSLRMEGGKCKAINTVSKGRDGKCPEGFEETAFSKDLCLPLMEVPREIKESVRGAPGPNGGLMCPDGGYEANEKEGVCAKLGECPTGFAISTENPFVCNFTGNMSSIQVLDRIRANEEQLALNPGNTSNTACGGESSGYILDPQNPGYCIKVA